MDVVSETTLIEKLDVFESANQLAEVSTAEVSAELNRLATELLQARRERLDELLEKERLGDRLAKLISVLPGAVLVLDHAGLVIECNRHAIELLDRPLIGRTWLEVVQRIGSEKHATQGEFRLSDGRCLSIARTPLEHESGEILLLTDISESHRLEQLLQQQNRLSAMGEMSARLAHQIRTPLSAALLYMSQLARTPGTPDAKRSEYVIRAIQRLRDLETLVDDMLLFAGGQNDVHEAFDLVEVAEDALETLAPQLDDPFQIDLQHDVDSIPVCGHRNAIRSAVLNVINNALQVSEGGERIHITLASEDNQAIVKVRDHGPGVPEEFYERVFEPFFSTRSQGTGLGLAVVNSVMRAHGGNASVRDVGDGAEFRLSLPAQSASVQDVFNPANLFEAPSAYV